MKCRAPMLAALLDVNYVAMFAHNLQSFDSVLLCRKVNGGEILFVQDICSNGAVIGNNQCGK